MKIWRGPYIVSVRLCINKLKGSIKAVISLKLWVPETSFEISDLVVGVSWRVVGDGIF